jgi:predicted TIM-barrel fold metal-dependent hydrolase
MNMIMKKILINLFLFAPLLCCSSLYAKEYQDLYFIDAHSQVDHKVSGINTVLERMKANNVKKTLLATRGKRHWQEILDWNSKYPNKIIPLVRSKGKHYQNKTRKYYKSIELQIETGEFHGVAEILIYHAQKGYKAPEVAVDLTDERVSVLLDKALINSWPFIIHIEFAALSGSEKKYRMYDLQKMLKRYPDHPFALIHMGQLQPDEASKLLNHHSNLHFITSHADPVTVNNSKQPWVNLFDGYRFKKAWKRLFIENPEKFIFAIDNVWVHHWGNIYNEKMEYWKKALSELPENVSHMIAHGNAERLWNLE